MFLRDGKISGELGVSFSPRLQNALSIAKQNKTPGASVLLTPDHQHREGETTHNALSPDEGIENNKETLSKIDEVQEKSNSIVQENSNSIVETPVRPNTSKVTVADPSTGPVASKQQQTYQLWGNPIFSNVNKNSTTVTTALGGAWGGPVSTTSQSSTAVQSDNLFSNLTIVNNDKTVVTSTNIPTHVTNTISSTSSLSHNLCNSQQLGCNFKMNSIKLDKFTGDSSVHPQTWWEKFQKWIDLYEVPNDKVVKVIAFQLSDEAAIWYATLAPEITNNLQRFKTAFLKRFTENERMLDLSILQTMQGPCENVREYLTRLAQTATNKNISEQILLAVGLNGLRPDIRKIVMNKEPANIEELRHHAILAEKSAVTGDNTLQSAVNVMQSDLQAIKSELMNISQPEMMKTDSFTARNNNKPQIRPQFEPRQYNHPNSKSQNYYNSRSQNYYNQNPRPPMRSFPRPQIRQNQNTYQPSDRCGFCGMDRHTRNVCPARDKICHNCRRQGHFSRVCQQSKRTQ